MVAAAAVVVAACLALATGRALADDSVAKDVTLEGAVDGGGTISLTLTADRSGVTRVELTGVPLECSENPGAVHFSPPLPVTSGAFDSYVTTQIDVVAVAMAGFRFMGTVVSADEVRGTVQSSQGLLSGPTCTGATRSWTAATLIETPPAPDDLLFAGTVEGGGTIALTADADGNGLTSLAVADLPLSDDCPGPHPLTLRAFLEPPADGSARVAVWASTSLDLYGMLPFGDLKVAYSSPDAHTLEGTLSFCFTEVAWTARFVPAPAPTATATEAAGSITTPTTTAAVTVRGSAQTPDPGVAAAPRALPPAGSPSRGSRLIIGLSAALAAAGGIALGAVSAHRLARRRR